MQMATISEIRQLRKHKIPALVFNKVVSGSGDLTFTKGWDLFVNYGEFTLSEAIAKEFDKGHDFVYLSNEF